MAGVITIKGDKKLIRDLRDVEGKVARKLCKTALRKGAVLIQDAAISGAPQHKGLLKKDIKIRAGKGDRETDRINVVAGKGQAFYAGFVDEGHYTGKRVNVSRRIKGEDARKAEYHRKSQEAGRKFIPGKHFMDAAFEQAGQQAAEVAAETLGNLVLEELKK